MTASRPFTRTQILARLREQIAQGRPIVGAGSSSGTDRAIGRRRWRRSDHRLQHRTLAPDGPADDAHLNHANPSTLAMYDEIANVVTDTPIIGGAEAQDPTYLDLRRLVDDFRDTGFDGLINFPTTGPSTSRNRDRDQRRTRPGARFRDGAHRARAGLLHDLLRLHRGADARSGRRRRGRHRGARRLDDRRARRRRRVGHVARRGLRARAEDAATWRAARTRRSSCSPTADRSPAPRIRATCTSTPTHRASSAPRASSASRWKRRSSTRSRAFKSKQLAASGRGGSRHDELHRHDPRPHFHPREILERLAHDARPERTDHCRIGRRGIVAKCAEIAGVDLLVVMCTGRSRHLGVPTTVTIGNANAMTLGLYRADRQRRGPHADYRRRSRRRTRRAGDCAQSSRRFVGRLRRASPTSPRPWPFRAGVGRGATSARVSSASIELIALSHAQDVFTVGKAYVDRTRARPGGCRRRHARRPLRSDRRRPVRSARAVMSREAAIELRAGDRRTSRARRTRRSSCLAHGGPFATPDDTDFLYANTDVQGILGESGIERMPIEQYVAQAARDYKAQPLRPSAIR